MLRHGYPEIGNRIHCRGHGIQCNTARAWLPAVICAAVTEVGWMSVVALVAVTTSVTFLDLMSVGEAPLIQQLLMGGTD